MPAKKKYNLIMFSMCAYFEWQPAWKNGGIVNRNYFMLQQMLKDERINKVLNVDFLPFNFRVTVKEYLKAKIYKKDAETLFKTRSSKTNQITEKLFVYSTIKSWPFKLGLFRDLKKILERLNMTEDLVVVSYDPLFPEVLNKKKLDSAFTIFETVDNWLSHPNFAHKKYQARLKKGYERIRYLADHIFTVADDLQDLFARQSNVSWLPNGVDFAHWSGATGKVPKDMQNISQPIVGYHGILQDRFDQDLLSYLANNNPEVNFVLVGWKWPNQDFSKIANYQNVHFLGQKNYQELPNYVANFAVALIPHKIDKLTKSMNPLKIYEYLAAGKQIITTPVAGIENFSDLIKSANSYEEINNLLLSAISQVDEISSQKFQERVKIHDWQFKLKDFLSVIPD